VLPLLIRQLLQQEQRHSEDLEKKIVALKEKQEDLNRSTN
jgi:hypothetical protein